MDQFPFFRAEFVVDFGFKIVVEVEIIFDFEMKFVVRPKVGLMIQATEWIGVEFIV